MVKLLMISTIVLVSAYGFIIRKTFPTLELSDDLRNIQEFGCQKHEFPLLLSDPITPS